MSAHEEEADTLIIFHAAEICAKGKSVHILMQDTDVLVLALLRLPLLNRETNMLLRAGEEKCCFNLYMTASAQRRLHLSQAFIA